MCRISLRARTRRSTAVSRCDWYPVTVDVGRDGRPRPTRGPVCLRPCDGDRCEVHVGLVTGADRLEALGVEADREPPSWYQRVVGGS